MRKARVPGGPTPAVVSSPRRPPALTDGFDELDRPIPGVFEPPTGFVLSAIARNKLIVVLFAVALAAGGLAFGRTRTPTYTATASIQVGQVNPNSPGFFGYVQSSASLATAFSRSITAEPVLAAIQKKLGLAPLKALARVSAAPVPQAPVFAVSATGHTRDAAVQLANVAADAVIGYENKSNSANPEASALLSEYRNVALRLQRYNHTLTRLTHEQGISKDTIAHVEASRAAEQAKLRAVDVAYTGAVGSQAPRAGLVSLLAGAAGASSDKKSKLELYGFLGLFGGIIAGCAAAVLRESVRQRRLGRV